MPSHSRNHRPAVPHLRGVYLFTEGTNHRYVGRAKDLNKRFGQHVAPSSPSNQAAFAFNIAKRSADQVETRTSAGSSADQPFRVVVVC